MEHFAQIIQIRKKCLITYTDYSTYTRVREKKTITRSGKYSNSAKKRFKKYLDLWSYTIEHTEEKISFITLTISSNQKREINYILKLKNFIEKIKTRYNEFNYCWKIEFQKNNNIHFHIIIDKEIDWKIVRSQWNKIQNEHVNEYQIKMKNKYKNGYYYDDKMINYKGEIIEDKIQFERYKKGKKANWRNPNSTDVKIETNTQAIGQYVTKYINKTDKEDEETDNKNKTTRFYGLSDTIRQLKYATIEDYKLDNETYELIGSNIIKEIKTETGKYLCNITEKITTDTIIKLEKEQINKNKQILKYNNRTNNNKLIDKEVNKYKNLFE